MTASESSKSLNTTRSLASSLEFGYNEKLTLWGDSRVSSACGRTNRAPCASCLAQPVMHATVVLAQGLPQRETAAAQAWLGPPEQHRNLPTARSRICSTSENQWPLCRAVHFGCASASVWGRPMATLGCWKFRSPSSTRWPCTRGTALARGPPRSGRGRRRGADSKLPTPALTESMALRLARRHCCAQ